MHCVDSWMARHTDRHKYIKTNQLQASGIYTGNPRIKEEEPFLSLLHASYIALGLTDNHRNIYIKQS